MFVKRVFPPELDWSLKNGMARRKASFSPKVWAQVYNIRKKLREFLNLWVSHQLYVHY
jgi:hypothetical protein